MRWPQTFILLAIMLFLLQVLWFAPEAEGAGGVKGGPYWNEQVYRDQQRAKRNQQRYDDVKYRQEVQQLRINNLKMRRYRQETVRKRRSTTYRSIPKTQPSRSSWGYRRANE